MALTGNAALLFVKGHISAGVGGDLFIGTVIANVIWATRGEPVYYLLCPSHVGPSDCKDFVQGHRVFGFLVNSASIRIGS